MNADLALRRTYQRHPVIGPALVYAFIGAWTVAGGVTGVAALVVAGQVWRRRNAARLEVAG